MTEKMNVAIIGVGDVVGEAILTLLEERDFPVGQLFPLDIERAVGNKVQFNSKYYTVGALESFDFTQVQIAFFAVSDELAAEYVPKATASGCVVIDNSTQFREQADVPLVVAEINPEAVADFRSRNIIASPDPMTTLMLLSLKPVYDAVGITRLNVSTYQAVSDLGKPAIEELASQTVALLSMQDVKREVFDCQIAFNILGQIGMIENNGYSSEEMRMLRESQKILRDQDIVINVTAVRVPVFIGHSAALNVETGKKITAQAVRELFENSDNVNVLENIPADQKTDQETSGLPTAVSDAVGSDVVHVGRIRESISHPHGLDMWIVGDNVRRGAALNSVQIAEFLVKDFL